MASASAANLETTIKGVGIVIPTFRESDNIQSLIREILKLLPLAQIVVIDDSPDMATIEAAESLGLANVYTTHRREKGGRGSAVIEGMRRLLTLGCTQLLEMDADFSHPPQQIPELLQQLKRDRLDLLIAARYLPSSQIRNWPLSRKIFSRLSNILAKFVLRVPVSDYTNGFRIYTHACAEFITQNCGTRGKGFIALSEILVACYYSGHKVGETPTIFVNRQRGESSLSLNEITNALTGLFKIFLWKRELQARN